MVKTVSGHKMRDLANMVAKEVPGFGFCLMVFPSKEEGMINYISNANRDDMIEALEEQVKILKDGRDFMTPEHN